MNIELSTEATEFGQEARRALAAAGGDDLVQQAEREPKARAELVDTVLSRLGAWDLAPREDATELEAAAALCRSAGYWALPYPVAERLARPAGADGLIVISGREPAGAVAGLDLRWATVTLAGEPGSGVALPSAASPRDSAFLTALDIHPAAWTASDPVADVALALTLPCWTLLGMLDRAIDLARAHVTVREQFGRPLAQFQGVQFQLTDGEVEHRGVEMLARYALWSLQTGSADAIDDALALRLAAIEAADTVFRVTHQVHGALGFCDESPLSWLSRYSRPLRRLPTGLSETRDALSRRLGRRGLTGLFSAAAPGSFA
ncbi:acyl-CoA dehydrogenase family protein [Nocardia sp. alder85J]|uniref:acyl-CoA dehydrogenase family protein n=1 Tax=Nocardia sp. alder85J TaxID=2862949 RepID=UPI001CD7F5E7|nr:acyl-CoA dehydrogenase family protein [Nocardia sp. alder85J]MCX4092529.1 acyl-CoA dehydrogenase family protein [Nocardia sp. alder85J]